MLIASRLSSARLSASIARAALIALPWSLAWLSARTAAGALLTSAALLTTLAGPLALILPLALARATTAGLGLPLIALLVHDALLLMSVLHSASGVPTVALRKPRTNLHFGE